MATAAIVGHEIFAVEHLAARFDASEPEIIKLLGEAGIEAESFAGKNYFGLDALKLLESELSPRELLAVEPTELKAIPPESDK